MGENNKKSNERETLLGPIKKKVHFYINFSIFILIILIFWIFLIILQNFNKYSYEICIITLKMI